jgi:coenzyme F420-reducing hydrogenase delta subunit
MGNFTAVRADSLNVVAYCCHYCAYGAADLAGSLRLQYPASVKVIKMPCTGRLDVPLVLGALEYGADGVMIAGCLEGDCHFQQGNLNARRRVDYVKDLLRQIGLEPERVRLFNMSSAMAGQFVAAATEMTERVTALGPNPLRRLKAEP